MLTRSAHVTRRPAKVKRALLKKTGRHCRDFVHRAGYHACVSHYSGGVDGVNRFSGTCLNRQIRINEKIRLADQAQIVKEMQERNARRFGAVPVEPSKIPAWSYIGVKGATTADRIRNKRIDSTAPGARALPVFMFSDRTRRIIKDKATAFYRSAGRKKIFCTLTFLTDTTDAVAVTVLNKFLTVLRREHENLQYLWVAERQTKNNDRIHFHLIINTRIGIRRFNALWILQQYNAGIVHEKYTAADIQARYQAGTLQEIFNPVDVVAIRNIGKLAAYLTKYVTKGANTGGFGCRVWHCSRGVSALVTKQLVSQECIEVAKSFDNCIVDKKTGEILAMPAPMKNTDGRGIFYTVWRINQPGRFLCFLQEMELINKWIMSTDYTRSAAVEYLQKSIAPDEYRKYFLN